MADIRDQISRIIQDKAYKQSTIAQRAGMSSDQFCAILKKRRKLEANELFRVCDALRMSPEAVASYGIKKEEA